MSEEQRAVIDDSNLDQVWVAVANCVKKITGDVDPSTDGTLQAQINELKSGQGSNLTVTDDSTGTKYKIGINNGLIYTEEVEE